MKTIRRWLPGLTILLWLLSTFTYHWSMRALENKVQFVRETLIHDHAVAGMVIVNGSTGIMVKWDDKLHIGYVLTCHHVVREHKNVLVQIPQDFGDAPYQEEGTVLYTDREHDLAILSMTRRMPLFEIMSDQEFRRIKVGMAVWAAGSPTEDIDGQMLTYGHILDMNRSYICQCPRHENVTGISHDATIWYGFSGGPLIDALTGKVIGINYKLGPTFRSNDGMAIPAPVLNDFLKKAGVK